MKKIEVGQAITIVANLGVIVGIAFLAFELRQQQMAAEVDAGYRLQESNHQARLAIIENADIWRRGNAGLPLDPAEAEIYRELIRIQWGSAYWISASSQALGGNLNVTVHDFAGFLHQNPGARKVWEDWMAEEQFYRERLIPVPVGVELRDLVFADLERLGVDERE